MASLHDPEIVQAIIGVLQRANTGKGSHPGLLTAYQILRRLPDAIRTSLETEYAVAGGKGAGRHYSAATHIARTAVRIENVRQYPLDTGDLQFELHDESVDDADVEAGYGLCALFRLDPESALWTERPNRKG